ncbi:MAG: VTT domain-containing protein [Dehalococcoidales bacterium]|jgi:membrane protein DedA with SNARE-associated domain|nr:VTT domain-containing protein [Dehalococcoidales bacterium]MDD4465935.1 VTT domain-containing protein [Dehalococcoidales bacterium]
MPENAKGAVTENVTDAEPESRNTSPGNKNKWQYALAILTIVFTLGLGIALAFNWDAIYRIAGYGYAGGFVISALGSATIIVPVPMLAVQFALGGVVKPLIGPNFLGPLFVGGVCSLGETLGALSIYITGVGGSAPFSTPKSGWWKRLSDKIASLIEKRGRITLFLLSAIMNPFFYPASIMMGASRFGIKRYALITFAGKFIKCSLIAYAGYFGFKGIFSLFGIDL